MNVVKRNGTVVPFEKEKIISAINKAFIEVDGQLYETETAEEIADLIAQCDEISVEEIQDRVEELLMASERKDVARAYVRYRYKREIGREKKNEWMKSIREKLMGENIQNSNANLDEASFGGRMGEAANEMTKQMALEEFLSPVATKNHKENIIYTHDLSTYVTGQHNCLSCPVDDLLKNGFITRQVDIRPANSISTAFQLLAVIFQIQSLQMFGGVSATHIDTTMVPYVRKSFYKHYKDGLKYLRHYNGDLADLNDREISIEDEAYKSEPDVYEYAMNMTKKELNQAAEGLLHNLR